MVTAIRGAAQGPVQKPVRMERSKKVEPTWCQRALAAIKTAGQQALPYVPALAGGLAVASLGYAFRAEIGSVAHSVKEEVSQPEFLRDYGLPLLRTGCHLGGIGLVLKNVKKGMELALLPPISLTEARRAKLANELEKDLIGDVVLAAGLIGGGLLLEGLESDLNLHMEKQKVPTNLFGKFQKIKEMFADAVIEKPLVPANDSAAALLKDVLKLTRFTPLESLGALEASFGFDINEHAPSPLLRAARWARETYQSLSKNPPL